MATQVTSMTRDDIDDFLMGEDRNQRILDRQRDIHIGQMQNINSSLSRGERPNLLIMDDPEITQQQSSALEEFGHIIRDQYRYGYGGSIEVPYAGERTVTNTSGTGEVDRTAVQDSINTITDIVREATTASPTTATATESTEYTYATSNIPSGSYREIDLNPYRVSNPFNNPFNNMPIGDYPNNDIVQDSNGRFINTFNNPRRSDTSSKFGKYGTSVKVFDEEIEDRIEVRIVHCFSIFDVMYYVVCPATTITSAGSSAPDPDDMFVVKEIKQ